MASNPTYHFINLLNLLMQEKDEDLAQYQRKIQSTSIKERRANGVLWYPCEVNERKYDAGERLIIKVENQRNMFLIIVFLVGD